MKTIIMITILGMLTGYILIMSSAALPEYRVIGTEPLTQIQEEPLPSELKYMSRKMYHLKTGRSISNEISYKKQQNFWGKGIPARVSYPSHLAEWEEFRQMQRTVTARMPSDIAH